MNFLIGKNMTGGYGGADILHDCTIGVEKGEIAVIVGPNGAGKSTAMKAVFGMLQIHTGQVMLDGNDITALAPQDRVRAGMGFVPQNANVFTSMSVQETIMGLLDRPDAGAVLLDGEDLQHLSASRLAGRRRCNIGYLFQDAGLVSRMRVFDSVCMPLRYAGLKRSSVDAQARAALEAVDLGAMATRRVEALSGGERQRVGLARALASWPRLLVCDEPSAALDETTTSMVGRLLRAYADEGGAVVVATHDPLLMPLADKTVRFDRGSATSTR